jgi:hypothetical protein
MKKLITALIHGTNIFILCTTSAGDTSRTISENTATIGIGSAH